MRIEARIQITRVVVSALVLSALIGCFPNENEPDDGSITYTNESEREIVVVTGFLESLEATLNPGNSSFRGLSPGESFSRSYQFSADPDDGDYCAAKGWTTWILATDVEGSRVASDYEVLDQIGPNKCWDERDAAYAYVGDG